MFRRGHTSPVASYAVNPAGVEHVQRLIEGQVLFNPEVMRRAARPQQASGPEAHLQELTNRELEILQMVAEGMGNREIARELNISYHTTMKHVSNIISKLRVSNRMEAGLIFLRHGRTPPTRRADE